jgi:hypothetical protein
MRALILAILISAIEARLDIYVMNSYSNTTYLRFNTTAFLCPKYGTKITCGGYTLIPKNISYNGIATLGFLDYVSSKYTGKFNVSIDVCQMDGTCNTHLTDIYFQTPGPLTITGLSSTIVVERDLGFPMHYVFGIKMDFKKDLVSAYLTQYGYYYIVVHDPTYNW